MEKDDVVLDASAVLALLRGEPGAERVRACQGVAWISAVNLAEVVQRLVDAGGQDEEIRQAVAALPCRVAPFDVASAMWSGLLRRATRLAGLSLGDRACLALADEKGLPALTADRAWATLDLGMEVVLIR